MDKIESNRRDFLKAVGGISALGALAGCAADKVAVGGTGTMSGFRCAPMERIRVGYIGVGERGSAAVHRCSVFPGIETTAVCDIRTEAAEANISWLKEHGKPGAKRCYAGTAESWKRVCEDPEVDVVYIATPAVLHYEEEIYALNCGKHVMVEVPGCQTLEQCWNVVEACEKARRHCLMLENACYHDHEMLMWNMVHKGLIGTLTHAEGAYIHHLVWRHCEDSFRNNRTKAAGVSHRYGNGYPTHPLGPICFYMDMNRGDRMEKIVSISSLPAAHAEFCAAKYPPDAWQNRHKWLSGDMNTSIIRTAKGRTIMLQYDLATPRPYTRLNLIQGTKGCIADFPLRMHLSNRPGGDADGWHNADAHWMGEKTLAATVEKYEHPLWKRVGKAAKTFGGHGGCDFIMDLRWIYCLQQGLPLDMDVYDLASWSSIVPCSAESDRLGGEPVMLPDFTRGAWATTKPISVGDVDLEKMGLDLNAIRPDEVQYKVL